MIEHLGRGSLSRRRRRQLVGAGGEHGRGQADGGGDTPNRVRGELDMNPVARRETADHCETERARQAKARDGRTLHRLVGFTQLLGAHTDTEVGDRDDVAVAVGPASHLDVSGRGRELRGVVEQFGEQVGDIGRGVALEQPVVEGTDVNARVVLDFGDGGAHHVGHGNGLAPTPLRFDAGQHEQALGVPPHPGGEVIELEEVVECVGIGFVGFELVEE
jgi:hypothetical protein